MKSTHPSTTEKPKRTVSTSGSRLVFLKRRRDLLDLICDLVTLLTQLFYLLLLTLLSFFLPPRLLNRVITDICN